MNALRTKTPRMAEASLTLAFALASPLAWSADLTPNNLKTFVPGTPATAGDVNANFSAAATAINSKQDRVTGVCPAGQAVLSVNPDGSVVCDTSLNNRVTTIETSLLGVTDYRPVGPQTNVMALQVALGGWTVCYTELYNAAGNIANILAVCNKANLMLACRPVGTNTYGVLAQAPRADVIFSTPADATTVHIANGSAWYFNTSFSWGFLRATDTPNKSSCDFGGASFTTEQRLCWHTSAGNLNGGYRCGATEGLNGSTAWERVVLHRN